MLHNLKSEKYAESMFHKIKTTIERICRVVLYDCNRLNFSCFFLPFNQKETLSSIREEVSANFIEFHVSK